MSELPGKVRSSAPLNLRQIEVFHAIMITGSLSAAGRLLHVTQPAISRDLARLRLRLEDPLLVVVKGRFVPTERALELHASVHDALAQIEAALRPPEAFDPPPKVVSAIVRMVPLPAERLRPVSARAFETVVARAFSQRRKMLRRVLADWAPQVPWEALDIAPTARAEDISVDRYIRLSDALVEAGVLQGG